MAQWLFGKGRKNKGGDNMETEIYATERSRITGVEEDNEAYTKHHDVPVYRSITVDIHGSLFKISPCSCGALKIVRTY